MPYPIDYTAEDRPTIYIVYPDDMVVIDDPLVKEAGALGNYLASYHYGTLEPDDIPSHIYIVKDGEMHDVAVQLVSREDERDDWIYFKYAVLANPVLDTAEKKFKGDVLTCLTVRVDGRA